MDSVTRLCVEGSSVKVGWGSPDMKVIETCDPPLGSSVTSMDRVPSCGGHTDSEGPSPRQRCTRSVTVSSPSWSITAASLAGESEHNRSTYRAHSSGVIGRQFDGRGRGRGRVRGSGAGLARRRLKLVDRELSARVGSIEATPSSLLDGLSAASRRARKSALIRNLRAGLTGA
eukprot:scaffold6100_cov54-Phaeocystis_antarctica.AAC.2